MSGREGDNITAIYLVFASTYTWLLSFKQVNDSVICIGISIIIIKVLKMLWDLYDHYHCKGFFSNMVHQERV